jgi:hypothetical protein
MAEFRENVDENIRLRALTDIVNRICERAQPQFANPIKVELSTDPETGGFVRDPMFLLVVEVETKPWLGIISRRRRQNLFLIDSGFWGSAKGMREVRCSVYCSSLLEIVKEEVQKYADDFHATVNLEQEFAFC